MHSDLQSVFNDIARWLDLTWHEIDLLSSDQPAPVLILGRVVLVLHSLKIKSRHLPYLITFLFLLNQWLVTTSEQEVIFGICEGVLGGLGQGTHGR